MTFYCDKRDCTESSARTVWHNLIRAKKLSKSGSNNNTMLPKKPKWVTSGLLKTIGELPPNSSKNMFTSLVGYLKLTKGPKRIQEKASKGMYDKNALVTEHYKSRKKTPKQTKNWVTLESVRKMFKDQTALIKARGLHGKEELTGKERGHLQKHLMLSLHGALPNMPPGRLSYADVFFVSSKDPRDDKKKNYLWKTRNGYQVLLNVHKTSRKKGPRQFKLPAQMSRILNRYIKSTNLEFGDPLFIDRKGQKMSRNSYSKRIIAMFEKSLGKKVGTSLLRNVWLSEKHKNLDIESMAHDSKIMGHSVQMAMDHYVKK